MPPKAGGIVRGHRRSPSRRALAGRGTSLAGSRNDKDRLTASLRRLRTGLPHRARKKPQSKDPIKLPEEAEEDF